MTCVVFERWAPDISVPTIVQQQQYYCCLEFELDEIDDIAEDVCR